MDGHHALGNRVVKVHVPVIHVGEANSLQSPNDSPGAKIRIVKLNCILRLAKLMRESCQNAGYVFICSRARLGAV